MNITTIQSETGLPSGQSLDMLTYVGAFLGGGVVVTAIPQVFWIAGYNEATLAVRNVRIEQKVQVVGSISVYSTFIRWTVENVGNMDAARFWVYVDGV